MFATVADAQTFNRRVLMEEYTGTWCENCPRGMASIEHLEKLYGDRFIAIAVHQSGNDPMKTGLYASGPGYPQCALNRAGTTDPFFGTSWTQADPIGIIHNIDYLLGQKCQANVEVTAQWTDQQHTTIEVKAQTVFGSGAKTSDFALAFVVVEDGMKGSGQGWNQVNKYVNDRDWLVMPEMKRFVEGTNPMTNMEYDHVAVDGVGIRTGIENSISEIVAGEPQTFTQLIDVSGNNLIQDKSKLRVVAILLNRYYGDVENSAQCTVLPFGGTESVDDAVTLTQGKRVYNLQGRQVYPHAQGNVAPQLRIVGGKKVIVRP